MKYSDILPDALVGKFVRQSKTCRWIRLKESGMWDIGPNDPDFILEKRDYTLETWEVKPDVPEDIYVYNSHNSSGAWYECTINDATHKLIPVKETK